MASEDVEFRLDLKNRAQTAAGIRDVAGEFDNAGDQAAQAGRRAAIAGRDFDAAGKAGRLAGKAIRLGFVGVAAASYGAFKFSQSAIANASDLSETVNKSNVIFGDQAKNIRVWARSADESFGLSKEAALGSAAGFGDMFTQIGFVEKQSARMSKGVVEMAADFGSFNNLGTEDVLERISAGFRGEYDSLQKLVPNINAARVQQEALNETGKESADALTAQDKALAVLNILHKDGARAAGDFERTSDGLANKQKILGAEYDNVSAKIGKTLLPLQLDLVNFISDRGIPALNNFADWFREDGAPAIGDFVDRMRPLAAEVLPAARDALGAVRDIAEDAAPYVSDLVGAFRGMPDWAQKALVGGVVIGGAGMKLKNSLPGQAASGLLGSVASMARPVPVYVVNDLPGGGPGLDKRTLTAAAAGAGAFVSRWAARTPMLATAAAAVTSAPDVFSTLKDSIFGDGSSNLEKAAKEFGYSMDRLAFDVATYGDQGSYFQRFQTDMESRASPGFVKELFGFIPGASPYVTDKERAENALKGLALAAEGADSALAGAFKPLDPSSPSFIGPKPMIGPQIPTGGNTDLGKFVRGKGISTELPNGLLDAITGVDRTIKIKTDPPKFSVPGLEPTTRDAKTLDSLFGAMGKRRIEPLLSIYGLDKAQNDLDVTQGKVDRLAQPRTSSLTVYVGYEGATMGGGLGAGLGIGRVDGARARGGPVARGNTYLVGEHGPELMEAKTDGYVHPNRGYPHLERRQLDGAGSMRPAWADDLMRALSAASSRPIVVQSVLDGEVLTKSVHRVERDMGARS